MSVLCLQLHIVFNLKNMLMLLCEGDMCVDCTLLQCVCVCHAAQGDGDKGESMCRINTTITIKAIFISPYAAAELKC